MTWAEYTLHKQLQRHQAVERHLNAFERKVLVAYLDRSLEDLPTYHPARALKIFRRWPSVVDRAFTLLKEGKLL